MKKILFVPVCVIALSGCADGGDDAMPADVSEKKEKNGVITDQFDRLDDARETVGDAVAKKNTEVLEAMREADKVNNINDKKMMEKDVPEQIDMANASCKGATITTNQGVITVEFAGDKAPIAVANFCTLAKKNFYDGVIFHRVIKGFMIQGGDPDGTGRGGPGYRFPDELPAAGEYKVGSLAMANAGANTNGSQFFIVSGPNGVGLPPQYTLFGQVTEGLDIVEKIQNVQTGAADRPAEDVVIESVVIAE